MQWQQLPLYEDWDYSYSVVIEKINYKIRFIYSDRTKGWTADITAPGNVVVVQGKSVNIRDAIMLPYYKDLSGVFWLEPKYENINESYLHPSLVAKYFNLYYGWGIPPGEIVERALVRNETTRQFSVTSSLYPLYIEDYLNIHGRNFISIQLGGEILSEEVQVGSRSFEGIFARSAYQELDIAPDQIAIGSRIFENVSVRSVYNTTSTYDEISVGSRRIEGFAVYPALIRYNLEEEMKLEGRGLSSVSIGNMSYTNGFSMNSEKNGLIGYITVSQDIISITPHGLPNGLLVSNAGRVVSITGTNNTFTGGYFTIEVRGATNIMYVPVEFKPEI